MMFNPSVKDLAEASTPGTSMTLSDPSPGMVLGAAQLMCGKPLSAESARVGEVRAFRRHAVNFIGRSQLVGSRAVAWRRLNLIVEPVFVSTFERPDQLGRPAAPARPRLPVQARQGSELLK